jgi:F0F1-type ATP synthase delta subunit
MKTAQRLIQLLANAPDSAWDELSTVLRTLAPTVRRRLCKDLLREVSRRTRAEMRQLEYAGVLSHSSVERLEKTFSQKIGQRIQFTCHNNPHLIGGIRITIGDRRWEYTVRSMLNQFLAA